MIPGPLGSGAVTMMRAGHAGRAAWAALVLLAAATGAPPAHGRASPEELDSGVEWQHLPPQRKTARFEVAFGVRILFSHGSPGGPATLRISHPSGNGVSHDSGDLAWLALAEPAMERPLVFFVEPPVPEGLGVRVRRWGGCAHGRYALLLGHRDGTVAAFHWYSEFSGALCCVDGCFSCPELQNKGWGMRWSSTLAEIRELWWWWAPQYAAGGGWEPAWSRRLVEVLSGRLGGGRTAATRTSPGVRSVTQAFRIAIPVLQIARRSGGPEG